MYIYIYVYYVYIYVHMLHLHTVYYYNAYLHTPFDRPSDEAGYDLPDRRRKKKCPLLCGCIFGPKVSSVAHMKCMFGR